mgnify:FL=1
MNEDDLQDFTITDVDPTRALRLVLAGPQSDADAANAVYNDVGPNRAALVRLTMCLADIAGSVTAKTVGRDNGIDALLSDLDTLLPRNNNHDDTGD